MKRYRQSIMSETDPSYIFEDIPKSQPKSQPKEIKKVRSLCTELINAIYDMGDYLDESVYNDKLNADVLCDDLRDFAIALDLL